MSLLADQSFTPAGFRPMPTIGLVALAAGIFVLDTLTPVEVSVSVLYVLVVMLAALLYRRSGVLLFAAVCVGLTVLSHVTSPGDAWNTWALVDRALGLFGLAISMLLVLRNQAAEETLREQANFLNLTHDSIFARDTNDLITYWNRGAEELYGWKREEAIGKTLNDLFLTRYPVPIEDIMRELRSNNRWEGILTRTRRDGTQVAVASRWSIQPDARGGLSGILETNNDITERQRAEDALQRSEAYLSDAQRLSRTGSLSWRSPHEEYYWSAESYRIYGCDPDVTTPSLNLMLARTHPDDRGFVEATILRAYADQKGFDVEHRLAMPDGSTRFVHLVARATKDRSGRVEFVGALMDITAAKRAVDELQQAQADLARITRVTTMGQLAASIAHEINQPLTGVVTNGYTCLHWLNENSLDLDKARTTAQRMLRDGERASEVIRRVQSLMTKTPPQMTEVEINNLIRDVLALTQTELRTRGVVVETELAPGLPTVLGDPVQLQQVLLNLVVNGIDAVSGITDRPKTLVIGSQLDDNEDGLVFVRDHGVGLDEATADKIFNPFFTTKAKGMGMGLAICRSIIEAHGGRLWATPATPHGALFQFTIPSKNNMEADA